MASDARSVFITASLGFDGNVESFHFARKGLTLDAENIRGLRLIPARRAEHRLDVTLFRLFEGYQLSVRLCRRSSRFWTSRGRDVAQCTRGGGRIDERAGVDDRAADDLLQLAHIAGPPMRS